MHVKYKNAQIKFKKKSYSLEYHKKKKSKESKITLTYLNFLFICLFIVVFSIYVIR